MTPANLPATIAGVQMPKRPESFGFSMHATIWYDYALSLERLIPQVAERARAQALEEAADAVRSAYIGARDGCNTMEDEVHDVTLCEAARQIEALSAQPQSPRSPAATGGE